MLMRRDADKRKKTKEKGGKTRIEGYGGMRRREEKCGGEFRWEGI
jgi:hypothetical protein